MEQGEASDLPSMNQLRQAGHNGPGRQEQNSLWGLTVGQTAIEWRRAINKSVDPRQAAM